MSDDDSLHVDDTGLENSRDTDDEARWLVVPPSALEASTLESVVEEYISREGTDYGMHEVDLATQKRRALDALERQEVIIVFDSVEATIHLLSNEEYAKRIRQGG